MKRLPEIHVYSRNAGTAVERIIGIDRDGNEIDLNPLMVQRVNREVIIGEVANVEVTFLARLIEHDTTPEPRP